jgi:DNA-binding IclR family transcriptional regulator
MSDNSDRTNWVNGVMTTDIKNVRREYNLAELDTSGLTDNPIAMFEQWLNQVVASDLSDPTAMVLATVDSAGRPSQRTVLLKEVRATGLAYDMGERYEDVRAVAAPILNHEGMAVAAVVIAGPAFRLTRQYLKTAAGPLKQTAADIAQRLQR